MTQKANESNCCTSQEEEIAKFQLGGSCIKCEGKNGLETRMDDDNSVRFAGRRKLQHFSRGDVASSSRRASVLGLDPLGKFT